MKIHHAPDALKMRAASYPEVGDQLDAAFKGFQALAAAGFVLPDATKDWIASCEEVKKKYPKPA